MFHTSQGKCCLVKWAEIEDTPTCMSMEKRLLMHGAPERCGNIGRLREVGLWRGKTILRRDEGKKKPMSLPGPV